MKRLYDEFFYIPQHGQGKVREKVLLARIAVAVALIVLFLASMSLTAYAYFTYEITSGANVIQAAHFEIKVSISGTDRAAETGENIIRNGTAYSPMLEANKTYKVTLAPTEASTATTGFVVVTAENCDGRYHTQQLGEVGDTTISEIIFYIKANADTKVTFAAHWGTSSSYGRYQGREQWYIEHGDTVALAINGAEDTGAPTTATTATARPTEIPTSAGEPSASAGESTTTTVPTTSAQTTTNAPGTTGTSEPTGTTVTGSSAAELTTTQTTETTGTESTTQARPTTAVTSTEATASAPATTASVTAPATEAAAEGTTTATTAAAQTETQSDSQG